MEGDRVFGRISFEELKISNPLTKTAGIEGTWALLMHEVNSEYPHVVFEIADDGIKFQYVAGDDGEVIRGITLGIQEALRGGLAEMAKMFPDTHRLKLTQTASFDSVSHLESIVTLESRPDRPAFIHISSTARVVHEAGPVIQLAPGRSDESPEALTARVESTLKTFYGPGWKGYDKPASV